jgi:hypothetical protein
MWRLMVGSVLWVFSLVMFGVFDTHHPFLAFLFSVGSFYLPVCLFKSY